MTASMGWYGFVLGIVAAGVWPACFVAVCLIVRPKKGRR